MPFPSKKHLSFQNLSDLSSGIYILSLSRTDKNRHGQFPTTLSMAPKEEKKKKRKNQKKEICRNQK